MYSEQEDRPDGLSLAESELLSAGRWRAPSAIE